MCTRKSMLKCTHTLKIIHMLKCMHALEIIHTLKCTHTHTNNTHSKAYNVQQIIFGKAILDLT